VLALVGFQDYLSLTNTLNIPGPADLLDGHGVNSLAKYLGFSSGTLILPFTIVTRI
jgi:hypothetical protein